MERWVWLLAALAPAVLANTCVDECLKDDPYYKKSCPDGLGLGEPCGGSDEPSFCATPYSRCMDGECTCLPDFEPRNMTQGAPPVCVPMTKNEPASLRDPSADICRYSEPTAEDFVPEALEVQIISKEYNEQILGESTVEERSKRRVRRKRGIKTPLPPTVVSGCRSGQLCFQLGPSAYGVCRKPTCPVGKPGSTQTPCTVGDDSTCPNGYHCKKTGGQSYDLKSRTYSDATICCPSICDDGYYRNGRCWRDAACLTVTNDCEDRCTFAACRFMVDPCENRGMCLVPKTLPGTSPDYFWCKCAPESGKMGRVCEQDGEDLNRPSASKRIRCEGSLCEPPPPASLPAAAAFVEPAATPLAKAAQLGAAAAIPGLSSLSSGSLGSTAQSFASSFPSLSSAATSSFPSLSSASSFFPSAAASSKRSPAAPTAMTCRADTDLMCPYWASIGDCTNDRKKMLAKCDCACTRLMNKNKSIRYYPIPAYNGGFNN